MGARRGREPLSRHDRAFAAAAGVLLGASLAAPLLGVASFEAYPRLAVDGGGAEATLAALLLLAALVPFADRRGIER